MSTLWWIVIGVGIFTTLIWLLAETLTGIGDDLDRDADEMGNEPK